jgi:hypothetical protein
VAFKVFLGDEDPVITPRHSGEIPDILWLSDAGILSLILRNLVTLDEDNCSAIS